MSNQPIFRKLVGVISWICLIFTYNVPWHVGRPIPKFFWKILKSFFFCEFFPRYAWIFLKNVVKKYQYSYFFISSIIKENYLTLILSKSTPNILKAKKIEGHGSIFDRVIDPWTMAEKNYWCFFFNIKKILTPKQRSLSAN